MCGICNIFGRNRNRSGCGCDNCVYDARYRRSRGWCEPRMRTTCASGLGTESSCPCGCDRDYSRSSCGCEKDDSCERRSCRAYDACDRDCD